MRFASHGMKFCAKSNLLGLTPTIPSRCVCPLRRSNRHAKFRTRSLDSTSLTRAVRWLLAMLRRALARVAHTLDLASLFDLPDGHPDRMIAASVVLYISLGIIIAITIWNHWKAARP